MPGYTAETGLYGTTGHYRTTRSNAGTTTGLVRPSADNDVSPLSGPAACRAAGGEYSEDATYTYCVLAEGVTIRCGKIDGYCDIQFCDSHGNCWTRICHLGPGQYPWDDPTCNYDPSEPWITSKPAQGLSVSLHPVVSGNPTVGQTLR